MKKSTIFKIAVSLTLTLFVANLFAQNTPNTSTAAFTDVASYQEVTAAGVGESGSGETQANHTNYVTVDGTYDLVTFTNTGSTPGARYANSGGTAITHRVPVFVAPDPIQNPGAWTYSTLTPGNLSSTWVWATNDNAGGSPTTATITDASGAAVTTYAAISGNHSASTYPITFLNVGSTQETFRVDVLEQGRDGSGTLLCEDADSMYVTFEVIAQPQCTEDGTSSADINLCQSDAEDQRYDLVFSLVGTPPFHIEYLYTKVVDPDGAATTTYDFRTITTGSGAGSTLDVDDGESTENEANITGTLAGSGFAWTYTLPIVVDSDGASEHANDPAPGVANYEISGTDKTTHTFDAIFLNGHYSRKTDRLGTVGTPDAVGELEDHVLYAATSGDLTITLYPVPVTGNIFVLPN